jgi:hypothetical protein
VIVFVCAVLFVVAICGRTCRVERLLVYRYRGNELDDLLGGPLPSASMNEETMSTFQPGDKNLGSSKAPDSPARCPVDQRTAECKMTPSTVSFVENFHVLRMTIAGLIFFSIRLSLSNDSAQLPRKSYDQRFRALPVASPGFCFRWGARKTQHLAID